MSWTVVSPHLDDAVFGCGDWLALHPGSLVVTVFAGAPAQPRRTGWDSRCGFRDSAHAIAGRRDEDRRALALLQASPCWLPFCDSQYGELATAAAITRALLTTLADRDPAEFVLPLGLFHADHVLAHVAAIAALVTRGIDSVLVYEDAPYRGFDGLLQARLATLRERGIEATPARDQPGASTIAKQEAVHAYVSQMLAFGARGLDDLRRPERLWRLTLRPSLPAEASG